VRYAHIFLFACPGCNFPVLTHVVTEEKSSEKVADESFKIECTYCGLSSGAKANAARKHLVEDWPE
jgi:hypothetical protein